MKIIFGAGKELVKRIALDNDHHGQCRVAPKSRSNAEGQTATPRKVSATSTIHPGAEILLRRT
jgi:hypothetical protein